MIEGNIMTTSADCDDYTRQAVPAPAVLKPTAAFAELRARFGAEIDRALPAGWEAAQPDLRTLAERERDDVAQLALRCDNLVDAVEALTRRVAALERAAVKG